MKWTNKSLTNKQYEVNRKQQQDTWAADNWIREQGYTIKDFDNLSSFVLYAQRQAHLILKHHKNLITEDQQAILVAYHRKYFNYCARKKIKAKEAQRVLNISSKINRKLFKLYRQLPKAQ
jgi:hypothetical protein